MLNSTTTPHQLANLLGSSYPRLCFTLFKKGVNNLYKNFEIEKKSGGKRLISSPEPILKNLLDRLKVLLEELYTPHPAASAFVARRGIVYNAEPHIKKGLVFNIDLLGFYDHIHFGRVKGLLEARPYCLPKETAKLIAHMCCYKGRIPQGAPTSPVISNMICRKLDRELSLLTKNNRGFYTRYADDITVSFRVPKDNDICFFNGEKWEASGKLIKTIDRNGFFLNDKKTRGEEETSRQTVTGLKVNKKVNIDRRYIRTTRAITHALSIDIGTANIDFASKFPNKNESRLENVVAGRINYIGMIKGIDSSVYQTLAAKYNALPLKYKLPVRASKEKTGFKLREAKNHISQKHLEKCVWIVSFEDIDDLSLDEQLVQGTAFMVNSQYIYTCSHNFEKAGNPDYCYLSRITSPHSKFRARIKERCKTSDIAKLEICDQGSAIFESLQIYQKEILYPGYRVVLSGFPQWQPGHSTVTKNTTIVTSHFIKSTFDHYEVSAEISAGLSGGAVLNDYGQVIGMIVMGKTVSQDIETGCLGIDGTNAFISAKHLI